MHISPQVFKELIKKSYSLDLIYLLKLIEEQYDVQPLYEDSMKIAALYQSLIRKGLITKDEEKITTIGKDLLKFVTDENTKKIIKRKPITTDFEEWWKQYPPTDSFTINGKQFKGTRSLRRGKEECRRKFKTIIEEGEYTAKQLTDALKYEVNQKVERSVRERKNIMSFMQGSIPYLNQRTFESFIELMEQNKDQDDTNSNSGGPTDIQIMQNTLEFNEWMKKIKSNYYSDDRQMTNAFEKLRKIANDKNYRHEDNIQYNTMVSSSKSNDMVRWIYMA